MAKNVECGISETWLRIGWYFPLNVIFHLMIRTRDLFIDWENPTKRASIFPSEYNIDEVALTNQVTFTSIPF
jgi:hypothetical protein